MIIVSCFLQSNEDIEWLACIRQACLAVRIHIPKKPLRQESLCPLWHGPGDPQSPLCRSLVHLSSPLRITWSFSGIHFLKTSKLVKNDNGICVWWAALLTGWVSLSKNDHNNGQKKVVQLNPAIAHFKRLVKIILYTEVFTIANIRITINMLLGTIIGMLYCWKFVKSGAL